MRELKWKFLDEIEGLEDYDDYIVFENGWVYSFKSQKWLKEIHDKYGYVQYFLYDGLGGDPLCIKAHVLVAKAFIPNPDNLPTVDHLDRNKDNNLVDNLRWATHRMQSENCERPKTKKVKRVHDRTTGFVYKNCADAARTIRVDQKTIWKCCNDILKTVKGHVFEFID